MFIYFKLSNFINTHYLNYKSDILKLIIINYTLMYITTYIYIQLL